MDWYKKSIDEVLREQNTSSGGLTDFNASHRIEKYGENKLPEGKKKSLASKIWEQISDFLIIVLIIAAAVSAILGEYLDSGVILAIVVLNATLGIIQEGKAEKALESLKKMTAPTAKVIRDGQAKEVPAASLVPGDIVVLETGDIVPADMRLIESSNLKVDESSLTGESVPADKNANDIPPENSGIGDRTNMCSMGSVISYGRGKGCVVATGLKTQIGQIAGKLATIKEGDTPLQKNLSKLGKLLSIVCLAVCAVVFILGFLRQGADGGNIMNMFMISVSLAVAAIPEGLPAVVTIVLALGMKRMVSRNAIVKRLLAVETLGSVSVICSDKTGTLTQNEMTVRFVWSGGRMFKVTGTGYEPEGEFTDLQDKPVDVSRFRSLAMTLTGGALCNDAELVYGSDGVSITGDPTEGAIITAAAKAGLSKNDLNDIFPRFTELPFDSERKMMTTFHKGSLYPISYTKGAPDIVISRCAHIDLDGQILPFTDELRQRAIELNSMMASQALRVLAVAYREHKQVPSDSSSYAIENDMILLGLIAMSDPPRPEAAEAVKKCRTAGIRPVMITGDHKDTAIAVAEELDLMRGGDGVLTGADVSRLSDEELRRAVKTTAVYARVSPEDKVRIVSALKANGEITAMTGDGVNDAMALKHADIGVSMGITGTDVAKSTADMVLTDDNFASIVSAVEEGRIIYANIRKFVSFLLSCNIGEILIVFFAILFNLPIPLTAIQLLWLNLVTDSFPALALGNERAERDIMRSPPRSKNSQIIDLRMAISICFQAVVLAATVLCGYVFARNNGAQRGLTGDALVSYSQTIAFALLICCELLRSFSCRSERTPLLRMGIATNMKLVYSVLGAFVLLLCSIYIPFLRPLFKTVPLSLGDWLIIIVGCFIPLVMGELYKAYVVPILERNIKSLSEPLMKPSEVPARSSKKGIMSMFGGKDPTQFDDIESAPANAEIPKEEISVPDSLAEKISDEETIMDIPETELDQVIFEEASSEEVSSEETADKHEDSELYDPEDDDVEF
ncbi:MAG: cation-translocating P-type ATPase [Clostridiales bacterium]|nr:cation-translocating P-type ATPase [Clostridiales bacterium]